MISNLASASQRRAHAVATLFAGVALVTGAASAADKPAFPDEFDIRGVDRGESSAPLVVREFAERTGDD